MLNIPVTKLKFMDEAHVVEKDVGKKKKVLSFVNHRAWMTEQTLHSKSFTLILMLSLEQDKETFFHLNFDNNNGKDPMIFVADAVKNGFLLPGLFSFFFC